MGIRRLCSPRSSRGSDAEPHSRPPSRCVRPGGSTELSAPLPLPSPLPIPPISSGTHISARGPPPSAGFAGTSPNKGGGFMLLNRMSCAAINRYVVQAWYGAPASPLVGGSPRSRAKRPRRGMGGGPRAEPSLAYSPINCTTILRLRGRVSKSRRTTCCQVPRRGLPSENGTVREGPMRQARTWAAPLSHPQVAW